MEKLYNYEDRLVRFAGEVVFFTRGLPKDFSCDYYSAQLIRSSGSSTLNYGEAQGTVSKKDFIHKMSLVVKELKESRGTLKILKYIEGGEMQKLQWLLEECEELVAIGSKMIYNKK
ncbi:MAG: four helix bundle protein [Saprospiraceae bacterium]